MKITDTLGRDLDVAVVVKGSRGLWMSPLSHKIVGVPTEFVRVPHGPFALRVMVKDGADVLMHLNGDPLYAGSLPGGIHYLEHAGDGKPFTFAPKDKDTADVCDAMPDRFSKSELKVPRGHGLLFVVARFAAESGPPPHPPRQEYTFPFQLNDPKDHDDVAAGNLAKMIAPENPPNIDDITSREPGPEPRKRHCLTCGNVH